MTGTEPKNAIRSLPIGAEMVNDGISFRVWAPGHKTIEIMFEREGVAVLLLEPELDGYFSGQAVGIAAGDLYKIRIDGDPTAYPDPASRFQPQGPHGPSQIIDSTFDWHDHDWRGISAAGQVLYELHIGTFTHEGTWAAAIEQLPTLKELGVTCLEVMPVNEFAGDRGWGYDGVGLFAPFHRYGSPDDMRRFINAAHEIGIGVILDLVYNHFGPDGNYLMKFSDHYLSKKFHTDWGDAINFSDEHCEPVREFFIANALYWITEFHLDGFRFDATQAIVDSSDRHILAEISEASRSAAGDRSIYLINENEPQHTHLLRDVDAGGYGFDANWNDDFHHAAISAVTGRHEAYYTDHPGMPQEFISSAKYGYIYQGQFYAWQSKRRGTPALDLAPTAFVNFLQNHDQIANSARGLRLHQLASPSEFRAITALFLLGPQTPMLFMGQEWAASAPFLYFTGHNDQLAPLIKAGRAKELSQFASVATPDMRSALRDPGDAATFADCKLNHAERHLPGHAEVFRLHRDLLKLRQSEPTFRRVQRRGDVDGAVLGPGAFVLRYFGERQDDRLILINLGSDLTLRPAPEPLLAPPIDQRWSVLLATESPCYGGCGAAHPDTEDEGWHLPGRSAYVLSPGSVDEAAVQTRHIGRGSAQFFFP
ncbi:MAG: malto-oligosyltrehalose trehalohydrolase [Tepidisphaeraceae bacterium]